MNLSGVEGPAEDVMCHLEERLLVYLALLMLCGTVSAYIGLTAGIWSFLQVATVIEVLYWLVDGETDRDAAGQG